jgi:hypothetical protein
MSGKVYFLYLSKYYKLELYTALFCHHTDSLYIQHIKKLAAKVKSITAVVEQVREEHNLPIIQFDPLWDNRFTSSLKYLTDKDFGLKFIDCFETLKETADRLTNGTEKQALITSTCRLPESTALTWRWITTFDLSFAITETIKSSDINMMIGKIADLVWPTNEEFEERQSLIQQLIEQTESPEAKKRRQAFVDIGELSLEIQPDQQVPIIKKCAKNMGRGQNEDVKKAAKNCMNEVCRRRPSKAWERENNNLMVPKTIFLDEPLGGLEASPLGIYLDMAYLNHFKELINSYLM